MTFSIRGIGTAVPSHTMSQDEATSLARQVICETPEQAKLLGVLYRKSGVQKRHTVLPHRIALNWLPTVRTDGTTANRTTILGPTTRERMQFFAEHAPPLAQEASLGALNESGVEARDITHLVTVTCTGFDAPGVDTALMNGLKLRPTTQRIQVGFMGCHGAINGLRVAQALTMAHPSANVLLCAVELCSLHYRFYWDPQRIVANAIFADGAAAIVGSNGRDADQSVWHAVATGSCLLPDSEDAMSWRVGDHGFEMTLDARVPDLIRWHLRPWLETWLNEQGFSLQSIGSWAIHPGGSRILSAVEESLELGHEATAISREVLAQYGNMSSPTVLFILERLRKHKAIRPCVALGFGPGMFVEAAIFN